ncbi:MAG: hypothetical protein GY870_21035 [archaeon]|nr:hypothetical protein [archaeon]
MYFGAEILETFKNDKKDIRFKLAIARLYNAKVKCKALQEYFGLAHSTIRRWGLALKNEDSEKLFKALANPGQARKLTTEIKSFVKVRFKDIYSYNRRSYSYQIREEIKEVFGINLCSETLRPIFNDLKNELQSEPEPEIIPDEIPEEPEHNKVHDCDKGKIDDTAVIKAEPCFTEEIQVAENDCNPNHALILESGSFYSHHLGVVLFMPLVSGLTNFLSDNPFIIIQWIVSTLCGSQNIEQTKLINFDSLKLVWGKCIKSLNLQRKQLDEIDLKNQTEKILQYNGKMVNVHEESRFYYDPHSARYTGAAKLLKGWCAALKRVEKVLNMDFIHTSSGFPVLIEHDDNFRDMRERFPVNVKKCRKICNIPENKFITFCIDRGIYSLGVFQEAREKENINIITWEKGYKKDQWDENAEIRSFAIQRPRNSSKDIKLYCFSYIEKPWVRDISMKQIIVRATNPKQKTVEVSIIATNGNEDAESAISMIFSRWIQENDFKYLEKHFGINQIISYSVIPYKKIRNTIKDKEIESGKLKALKRQKKNITQKLGILLVKRERGKLLKKNEITIEESKKLLESIENEISQTEKKESKLEKLINRNAEKLVTEKKLLIDAIKITARNMFYIRLQPFRELYDNFRDDHVILRNLTQAGGQITFYKNSVEIKLYPTMQYPPQIKAIINNYLDMINKEEFLFPDSSQRIVKFAITEKISI